MGPYGGAGGVMWVYRMLWGLWGRMWGGLWGVNGSGGSTWVCRVLWGGMWGYGVLLGGVGGLWGFWGGHMGL